jgi:hypothetical protein
MKTFIMPVIAAMAITLLTSYTVLAQSATGLEAQQKARISIEEKERLDNLKAERKQLIEDRQTDIRAGQEKFREGQESFRAQQREVRDGVTETREQIDSRAAIESDTNIQSDTDANVKSKNKVKADTGINLEIGGSNVGGTASGHAGAGVNGSAAGGLTGAVRSESGASTVDTLGITR